MMRHICLQSVSILLLTHLVIEPAIIRLLVSLAGLTLFLGACQLCTGRAETVATVATTADGYKIKTTLALK